MYKSIMYYWCISLLVISVFLTGCKKREEIVTIYNYKTPSFVIKNSTVSYAGEMESTPVVYNSKVYDIISRRTNSEKAIQVFDASTKNLISSSKLDIALGSALVYQDELYVTGSTSWESNAPLKIYKSSDLIKFTEIGTLSVSSNRRIFNTSLIFENNKFILVVEEDIDGNSQFFLNFYESTDLNSWKKISELKFADYIACPTIRFINGEYFVFYLLTDRGSQIYYTSVSKSVDLVNWVQSNKVVIAPDESEGQNASDLDLVEFNSEVIINYAVGNQDSNRPLWVDIKKAKYAGTLSDFVKEFF